MRSKKATEYCEETGKYKYSSQAKANRAKNRYEDIKRVYFCESCESFHTTKVPLETAIREGFIERKEKREYTPEDVQKEINKVFNKIQQPGDDRF